MAEALMNRWGRDRFRAFSAGISPKGEVHPLALEIIRKYGLPAEGLTSKSWTQFLAADADRIDFIIMIRDQAAGEECPDLTGRPLTACWNVVDPAAGDQTPQASAIRFRRVFQELENRIKIMACLRLDAIDRLSLKQRADARSVEIETRA